MLTEGEITQETLISKLGTPCDIMDLPKHIGNSWVSAGFGVVVPYRLFESEPALFTMKEKFQHGGSNLAHAIVIDGRDAIGNLKVKDPLKGTRYEMTIDEFMEFWSGFAVFKKGTIK